MLKSKNLHFFGFQGGGGGSSGGCFIDTVGHQPGIHRAYRYSFLLN